MNSDQSSPTHHSNHSPSPQPEEVHVEPSAAGPPKEVVAHHTYHLQDLSEDILLGIWKRLDTPQSLVKVSHYFQDMGRDAYFQSQWILWKYGKWEAVFHAIKYKSLFSAELLKFLIAGGAIVSRTLVQGLAFAQVKTRVKRRRRGRARGEGVEGPAWGRNINLPSYISVLQAGAELYGNISFIAGKDDFSVFTDWLDGFWRAGEGPTFEEVSGIFEEGKFLPLPIALPDKSTALKSKGTQKLLVRALVKEPRLIPLASRNGAEFSSDNSQLLLRAVFSKEIGVKGVVDLVKEVIELLPGVKITRSLACQIMMSITVKENNVSYQSLKQLRFDPLLSHLDLKEIAGEIVTAIHHNKEKMASSLSLTSAVLEKACKTFEDEFSVDGSSFRQATINGLFSTLENPSTPAKMAQLRELDLTEDELYQALIQNPVQTTRGLKLAKLSFLIDGNFFSRLFETLLLLPFKGKLLQAIFSWYDQEIALRDSVAGQQKDELEATSIPITTSKIASTLQPTSLLELLNQEIMKYDIKLDGFPTLVTSSDQSRFLESKRSQASLLSFDYGRETFVTAKSDLKANLSSFGSEPRPNRGFMKFCELSVMEEDQHQLEVERKRGKVVRAETEYKGQDLVPLQKIVAVDNDPPHQRRRRGYYWRAQPAGATHYTVSIPENSPNSVMGAIPKSTSSNGASILNLMGDSKSVSIMFDHALLDRNPKLCNLFLEAGLPAPTLHQFKILAHLNSWIPQWMGPAIIKGAPFVKEYGVTEDDSELLSFQIPIFPKRGSNVSKSKKIKTEVASTVDADTSVNTSIDISNTASTFDAAGGDTTMTSIEDESEEKVDTSATSLRRSTREKHARFEAVKENDSESELSDEDEEEGQGEAQDQDDASSDDENEKVDGNQSEEAEVKMEGIEEGEEAMGQDRSFVMMEDGKPVKVGEKEFNSRTGAFEKWIAHLEGLQRKQEYNVALQKHQLPLTPAGRPSQRKIPKSTFHTQLDTLIVDIKSAHKKLLREGNLNLDMESDLSTRDLKAAKLVQELRNDMLELSNETKEHPDGAETLTGKKKRSAAVKSGLERDNLVNRQYNYTTYNYASTPKVLVENEKYEDSDDETWDVAFHARRRLLRFPAPPAQSWNQTGRKRKQRASSETDDSGEEKEAQLTIQKEVWYCSDSSHSSSESEVELSADEQQAGRKVNSDDEEDELEESESDSSDEGERREGDEESATDSD